MSILDARHVFADWHKSCNNQTKFEFKLAFADTSAHTDVYTVTGLNPRLRWCIKKSIGCELWCNFDFLIPGDDYRVDINRFTDISPCVDEQGRFYDGYRLHDHRIYFPSYEALLIEDNFLPTIRWVKGLIKQNGSSGASGRDTAGQRSGHYEACG